MIHRRSDRSGSSNSSDGSSAGDPMACACGFRAPAGSGLVFEALRTANTAVLGWDAEHTARAEARLSFMPQTFPSGVAFAGRLLIEGVYTEAACRGQGLVWIETECHSIACNGTHICIY